MDYDGIFTPNDASIFGTAYNTALPSVPEPGTAGVLLASLLLAWPAVGGAGLCVL